VRPLLTPTSGSQFVNCAPAGPQEHQDDLLFFVRRTINRHQPTSTAARQQAASPVFVRRKGRALPDDLQLSGAQFPGVDWARSVLLNLVLHAAAYQLTVVACGWVCVGVWVCARCPAAPGATA
jgi:hypothetical protein